MKTKCGHAGGEKASQHYDDAYFKRQLTIGQFGAWANQSKFSKFISSSDDVLDFGCGSGLLLKGLTCGNRVGVEINPAAIKMAQSNGIEVYDDVDNVPDEYVDTVISNNALEHTLRPLDELKSLHRKLRKGGKIIVVVPCESIHFKYGENADNHLYSWSPMNLGNLFTEAGFSVIESKAYIHKWPPGWRRLQHIRNRTFFEILCRMSGQIQRKWFQVRAIGVKN